jgi:CHASE2 domain-containing sensor protein
VGPLIPRMGLSVLSGITVWMTRNALFVGIVGYFRSLGWFLRTPTGVVTAVGVGLAGAFFSSGVVQSWGRFFFGLLGALVATYLILILETVFRAPLQRRSA